MQVEPDVGDEQTDHKLERLPPTPNKKQPKRRCRLCYRMGKRRETMFFCTGCAGQPALCRDGCFDKYHFWLENAAVEHGHAEFPWTQSMMFFARPPPTALVPPPSALVKHDAFIVKPDATIVNPDAIIVNPDATIVNPDATIVNPDAIIVKPDATIVKPDDIIVKPDNIIVKADDIIVKPSL